MVGNAVVWLPLRSAFEKAWRGGFPLRREERPHVRQWLEDGRLQVRVAAYDRSDLPIISKIISPTFWGQQPLLFTRSRGEYSIEMNSQLLPRLVELIKCEPIVPTLEVNENHLVEFVNFIKARRDKSAQTNDTAENQKSGIIDIAATIDRPIARNSADVLLTSAQVRVLCGNIAMMTLHRWLNDVRMEFPKPRFINNRRYWAERSIVDWQTMKRQSKL